MTTQQLEQRQHEAIRVETRLSLAWAIPIIVVLVACASVLSGFWNPPLLGSWVHRHAAVAKVEFFLLLATLVCWHRRAVLRKLRTLDLLCTGCRRPLTGLNGQMALSSGKCRHCKTNI